MCIWIYRIASIGHHCYVLHGVTLGATGKTGDFDRHPKVPPALSSRLNWKC